MIFISKMVVRKKENNAEELTQACDYWPDQGCGRFTTPPFCLKWPALSLTTTDDADHDGGRGRRRLPPACCPIHQD